MHCVLTLNAGSSSLKFGLFKAGGAVPDPEPVFTGLVDWVGESVHLAARRSDGTVLLDEAHQTGHATDHAAAVAEVLGLITTAAPGAQVGAVGHRVVHGGPDHAAPLAFDAELMEELAALSPFAPLHQPNDLAGVRAALAAFPEAVQVACFDTAFHRNHAFVHETYALPRAYYEKGVRRYGFHGLSYEYVAGRLAEIAPDLHAGRVVVAHLGNGASMCAMRGGRSVASTMGFTALDGLPMGTRTGQLDPGVVLYLMQEEGMSAQAVSDLLYRQSGLLGLSGLSNDMRRLEESDSPAAHEAIAYFVARIRHELGGLTATLEGLDALVFCGGIGENSARVRAEACARMGWLGLELDAARNRADETVISAEGSAVRVLVVPTNEEIVLARAAMAMLGAG